MILDILEALLSFIGWFLVAVLTLGLGLLYLLPYFNATIANFYEDLKQAAPIA